MNSALSWDEVKQIFQAALARASQERAAFVREACGTNRSLQLEVESLLAAHAEAATFAEQPACQALASSLATDAASQAGATPTLERGDRLGPYTIVDFLARGGMGEVYRACDTRLDRSVAIKLLSHRGFADSVARAQFETEARAIAALNEPHICTLYDVGDHQGADFLVMEFLEGGTLASRLGKGPLPIDESLRYAVQIAGALANAHRHGITHRDVKSSNIMVTDAGVKLLDFGLAQGVTTRPTETPDQARSIGAVGDALVGTVAYMSPEQAGGRPVGPPSDVFSFGVVLYEMLCGRRPFRGGSSVSTLEFILHQEPVRPREIRHEIPDRLERILRRCLQKNPDVRYATAEELLGELRVFQAALAGPATSRQLVIAASVVALLGAAGAGTWWSVRASWTRWAQGDVPPQVAHLIAEGRPLAALYRLREGERYAAGSPGLLRLEERLSLVDVSIQTVPSGADIYLLDYADVADADASRWNLVGSSPVRNLRLPAGSYRVRTVKSGFAPVERMWNIGGERARNLDVQLHAPEAVPPDMVWVLDAPRSALRNALFPKYAVDVPGFWMDRHEVTNQQFLEFVAAGGYAKPQYWKHLFGRESRTLSWSDAVARFHDSTGRAGPATWAYGTYPQGGADFPVTGVSWYEASAYAEFAHKSLPTVYHWFRAAGVGDFSEVLQFSNFAGRGLAAVGTYRGLGPFGTYDMAGNAKEWVSSPVGTFRYILGGSWNGPNYNLTFPDARDPFARESNFGFRCVQYTGSIPAALTGAVPFVARDRRADEPADAATFAVYRSLHAYDSTDLKAAVEEVDDSSPYWRRERVSFAAGYDGERVLAHLYIPRNSAPPYQVVVFFPGSTALYVRTIEQLGANFQPVEPLIGSGRVVIVPAYKGMLERGPGAYYHWLGQPSQWREMNLKWATDLRRSIDYLETRQVFDVARLAFVGRSLGGAIGPRLLAIEPRFKVGVLISGGSFEKVPPEVDSWNFASHVTIPVLMLNGHSDFLFPVESSQLPLFRLLGTAEQNKRHFLYEGSHGITSLPDVIRDMLDWLDHYLGPVQTAPAVR